MAGSRPGRADRNGDCYEPKTNPRRGRPARLVLAVIVLLAAADGGVYYILANRGSQSTDDASVEARQIVVSVPIAGQIATLTKEERAPVAKDDVLVTLDDQNLKLQVRRAIADRDLADQNVALAKLKRDKVARDLERATLALQGKVIPQKEYDSLASDLSYAEVQLKIAQSLAELDGIQVATAQSNLEHVVIKSPITGVIAKKWVSTGDSVQPAQAIYTLYDVTNIWVNAYFERRRTARIAVGDKAEISVDAFPGTMLTGKVVTLGGNGDAQAPLSPRSGDMRAVTIRLDRAGLEKIIPGKALLPGMTAKVRVRTGR
jgi:membrane fusion protein, multidrug efflux system